MLENFDEICKIVMTQLRVKNQPFVNQVLLKSMPRLAALNPEKYINSYLDDSINYLLNNPQAKPFSYISIGLLALAVKDVKNDVFKKHLPQIINSISAPLKLREQQTRRTRGAIPSPITDPSLFTCVALLAQAFGPEIIDQIKQLIEPMISTGLSQALADSLQQIQNSIPQLKKDIQEGLLRMLSHVLKIPVILPLTRQLTQGNSAQQQINQQIDISLSDFGKTILALKVLGQFDFQIKSLIQFVKHCADNYLSHDKKEVRLEAVKTCCQSLTPVLSKYELKNSFSLLEVIQNVLSKLLIVGVTDTDFCVRYTVLSLLDDKFDQHLAQAEHLNSLFFCLQDEVFEIRELSLIIIGRLSSYNPAYVNPPLRKVFKIVNKKLFLIFYFHSGFA